MLADFLSWENVLGAVIGGIVAILIAFITYKTKEDPEKLAGYYKWRGLYLLGNPKAWESRYSFTLWAGIIAALILFLSAIIMAILLLV